MLGIERPVRTELLLYQAHPVSNAYWYDLIVEIILWGVNRVEAAVRGSFIFDPT
jgi:hypothetical protein